MSSRWPLSRRSGEESFTAGGRLSGGAADDEAITAAPQLPQNRASPASSEPQFAQ
jgi:hypothetical protein